MLSIRHHTLIGYRSHVCSSSLGKNSSHYCSSWLPLHSMDGIYQSSANHIVQVKTCYASVWSRPQLFVSGKRDVFSPQPQLRNKWARTKVITPFAVVPSSQLTTSQRANESLLCKEFNVYFADPLVRGNSPVLRCDVHRRVVDSPTASSRTITPPKTRRNGSLH